MESAARLPDPAPEEIALSHALRARLETEIEIHNGFLPFERYMDLALYTPGLGYYVAGARQFGRSGDFITAPEISSLFGACLAKQCAATIEALGGIVIEFGAGSGRLAASVLSALRRRGVWPVEYVIIELSPLLRERQYKTLHATDPELAARVTWWQTQPAAPRAGVVIANEVIDALPVTLFEREDGVTVERGVGLGHQQCLRWTTRPASSALTRAVEVRLTDAARTSKLRYRSEINFRQATWLADLPRFIDSGVVILADYGYPEHEYYHADRRDGTLQCHYRHRVHNDVFWHPGLQDITASVDFTALAHAAAAAGFEVRGYADQANYLLSSGITDLLAEQELHGARAQYRAAQSVKTLLLPQAMGTRTKFMSLSVNYGGAITGYLLRDDRHRL